MAAMMDLERPAAVTYGIAPAADDGGDLAATGLGWIWVLGVWGREREEGNPNPNPLMIPY